MICYLSYGTQPFGRAVFPAGDSKLNKCLITTCPMPVRHIRWALDHIAFPEDLLRAAFFLVVADPACSQYNLSGRMGMPVRSHAGGKNHIPDRILVGAIGRNQGIDPYGIIKIIVCYFFAFRKNGVDWLLSCWAIAWKAGNSSKVMATAKHDV